MTLNVAQIRALLFDGNETNVKQHFEYDSNNNVTDVYTIQAEGVDWDVCSRNKLFYDSNNNIIYTIYLKATWIGSWDDLDLAAPVFVSDTITFSSAAWGQALTWQTITLNENLSTTFWIGSSLEFIRQLDGSVVTSAITISSISWAVITVAWSTPAWLTATEFYFVRVPAWIVKDLVWNINADIDTWAHVVF